MIEREPTRPLIKRPTLKGMERKGMERWVGLLWVMNGPEIVRWGTCTPTVKKKTVGTENFEWPWFNGIITQMVMDHLQSTLGLSYCRIHISWPCGGTKWSPQRVLPLFFFYFIQNFMKHLIKAVVLFRISGKRPTQEDILFKWEWGPHKRAKRPHKLERNPHK